MAFSLSRRLSDSGGRIVLAALLAEGLEALSKNDDTITPRAGLQIGTGFQVGMQAIDFIGTG
jgi:hypothetical protein